MKRLLRIAAVALVAATVLSLATAAAHAAYGTGSGSSGADLISADYERLEQGDDSTTYAAISADGRYAVMQTRARNFFDDDDADPNGQYRAGGLFRIEIATQALEKVVDGDLFDESSNQFLRRGASNPSTSSDGRFVAFSTAQSLIPADTNDNVDVYVRDMDVPFGAPGAFDLVSARSGGDQPAAYGAPPFPVPGSNPGSEVSRGVAISGDGRYVAFRTDAVSDLPAAATTDTPARQIFVRDRQANTTTLVTRTDPGGAPAGGGLGASISGDGSTVAWTGTNAPAQTTFLDGESTQDSLVYYMWRRVADGPTAPTRRITGVSDPDDPACPPGQTTSFDSSSTGPCYGPLAAQEGIRASITSQIPALSADGYTVAFLTASAPRPSVPKGTALDLFVTDMHPGITRKAGTTELTRASSNSTPATGSAIAGMSMAPDGRSIVIETSRTEFALPVLTAISAQRAIAGTQELYAIDLVDRTLDRVALSYTSTDINGDVQTGATISNGGERIAFSSFAGNLFFGDANQRPDAFVATVRPVDDAVPPPPPAPPAPPEILDDRLKLQAKSVGKGKATIRVGVPAAGGISVVASGRAGEPRSRRSFAKATARSAEEGFVEVPLKLVSRYRGELAERGKLRARARVEFVPAVGGERLTESVGLVFKGPKKKAKG